MSLVTIRALFCPGCGAPLDPGEQTQLRCAYCDSVLRIQQQRVSQTETSSSQLSALDLSSLPLAELFSSETGRFELSVLEQTVPGTHPDRFTPLGLRPLLSGDQRPDRDGLGCLRRTGRWLVH